MSSKELATVLAALRFWQQELETIEEQDNDNWTADSLHFQEHEPLTVEEIDDLCERLNFDAAPIEVLNIKHTATPWETGDSCWPNCIVAPKALPGAISLARVLEYRYASREDLQFLIHAVNNHDRLLAALEIAVGIANWAKGHGAALVFVDAFLAMAKPLTKGGD